jgi:GAF domain-containing protein
MSNMEECASHINDILAAINEINEFLITTEFNLDSILHIILQKALELSQGKYGQILLYNGHDLVIAATTGNVEKGTRLQPGECVCGLVVETKEAVKLDNVEATRRFHRFFDDAKSELAVPLLDNEKVLGVLNMESPVLAAFNEQHRALLSTLALQAAHAIKIARMYEQQKALAEIDRTLAKASSLPETVYELIIEKSLNLIGGRSGQLLLKEGNELVIAATTGQEKPMSTRVFLDNCISGIAVRSKKPLNVGDISKEPYSRLYKSYLGSMRSELVIPLLEKDEVIGVLNFENPLENYFDPDHMRILSHMADHATVAIRNLQLYQNFHSGLYEVKRLLSELEDYPDKMKKALTGFHKIVDFFEEREKIDVPSLFPPTEEY